MPTALDKIRLCHAMMLLHAGILCLLRHHHHHHHHRQPAALLFGAGPDILGTAYSKTRI